MAHGACDRCGNAREACECVKKFTARWGDYLILIRREENESWTGKIYRFIAENSAKKEIIETWQAGMFRDLLLKAIGTALFKRRCRALLDGQFQSIENFLVFSPAPELVED